MRDRYKIYNPNTPYFITSTTNQWLPILKNKKYISIIIDAMKYAQSYKKLKVYAYVIMLNHFHAILKADNLGKLLKELKSYTARHIIDLLKIENQKALLFALSKFKLDTKVSSRYQLWQEGFHPVEIQNSEIMKTKIEYIHFNPVRAGFVDKPSDWIYSSARNYKAREGILEIDDWPF